MRKVNGSVDEREPVDYPKYSDHDLDEFGKFLERFKETKEIRYPKPATIRPINMEEAMVAFGAMSKRMHGGKPSYAVLVQEVEKGRFVQPTKYDLFWHKYHAWQDLKSKRDFIEGKKLEGYEEISKTLGAGMRVEHIEGDDEGTV